MKYKVTIVERVTQYRSKVFEAVSEDDARTQAEADDSWTDGDGWEDGYEAAECSIEETEPVAEGR